VFCKASAAAWSADYLLSEVPESQVHFGRHIVRESPQYCLSFGILGESAQQLTCQSKGSYPGYHNWYYTG